MRISYVTSFTADMYEATGRELIDSFLHNRSDGTMTVAYEGDLGAHLPTDSRIATYDLATSQFLKTWIENNRDIIPLALGGAAHDCQCPGASNPWGEHERGCAFQWFNKQASRWFRKVVALDHVASAAPGDILVWLDSDCRFQRRLPADTWERLFRGASVIYHKSKDRIVLDSGVIAFKMNRSGRAVLQRVIERFRDGTFRQDERWDDGYQFQRVIDMASGVKARDLGLRTDNGHYMGGVLPSSPLGEYLEHRKGIHSNLRIMT